MEIQPDHVIQAASRIYSELGMPSLTVAIPHKVNVPPRAVEFETPGYVINAMSRVYSDLGMLPSTIAPTTSVSKLHREQFGDAYQGSADFPQHINIYNTLFRSYRRYGVSSLMSQDESASQSASDIGYNNHHNPEPNTEFDGHHAAPHGDDSSLPRLYLDDELGTEDFSLKQSIEYELIRLKERWQEAQLLSYN